MINSMMLHSLEDDAEISERKFKNYVSTCTFVASVFQLSFHSDLFWSFSVCFNFMSNSNHLMLLNFRRYLFPVNTIFLLMRNVCNEI